MIRTLYNILILFLISCSATGNQDKSAEAISAIIKAQFFKNKVSLNGDTLKIDVYAPVLEIAHWDRSMIIDHKILYSIKDNLNGINAIIFTNRENEKMRLATQVTFNREIFEDIIRMQVREPEYIEIRDYIYESLNAKQLDDHDQLLKAALDGLDHPEGADRLVSLAYGYISEQAGRLKGHEYEKVVRFFILATKELGVKFDTRHMEHILEYGQKVGERRKPPKRGSDPTPPDSLPLLREYIKKLPEGKGHELLEPDPARRKEG